MMNGVSVPQVFPFIKPTIMRDNIADGYIFLNNRNGRPVPYNIIFDNTGAPVWYLRTPDKRRDFKVQPNGLITMLVRQGYGGGYGHIAMDNTMTVIDSFHAEAGYTTDEHEFVMLENGRYLVIGLKDTIVDLSQTIAGASKTAQIRQSCVQYFDADKTLLRIFPAWKYYSPADLHPSELKLFKPRFTHMNAVWVDTDGHLVVSNRHISEITKFNINTGEIIWRLGGAHNEFKFIDDPLKGFSFQHAVSVTGPNRYLMFDNGTFRESKQSRAVEYELDTDAMTATLVWEFRNGRFSHYMGNAQRLPNGNTLINWAISALPKVTEVTHEGEIVYEMNWESPQECYRAFRFPWTGACVRPYLILEPEADKIKLLFNQFGAEVVGYNVYMGISPDALEIVRTVQQPYTVFHPGELKNLICYFCVTGIYADGSESAFSNQESVKPNFSAIEPGANLVKNGDFDSGLSHWIFEVRGEAEAKADLSNNQFRFAITQGGGILYEIQLRQAGIPLIREYDYMFEFDAWAENVRQIEAIVNMNGDPYIRYSPETYTYLTERKRHYAIPFTMNQPTDYDARVVINTGADPNDVYVDNIKVYQVLASNTAEKEPNAPHAFGLGDIYPNPFNPVINVEFAVQKNSYVTLNLYDLRGRRVKPIHDHMTAPGAYQVTLDSRDLPSGVYIIRLDAKDQGITHAQKVVLVR